MSMEHSLFTAVQAELIKNPVFVGIPVIDSFDAEKLGAIQLVIDVSDAIAAAPGTNMPYFKIPVEIVALSDRHDDPKKERLRSIYNAAFDFLTAPDLPAAFTPTGMVVRACIPESAQSGPDVQDNFNILTYKATFYVEKHNSP